MPDDDDFSQGLRSSIVDLQEVLRAYEKSPVPDEQMRKLISLQEQLSQSIREIRDTIEPEVAESDVSTPVVESPAKFSRARFYSLDCPYANKMDKSESFRLIPPMKLRGTAVAPQSKSKVSSQFLLSSLQLLENIRNLQRLQKSSVRDEACIDEPKTSQNS